jgi:transcriptional antiterminator RfaH
MITERVPVERVPLWYVLQTRAREEVRVVEHLDRRRIDVETFLPTIEVRCRHARRTRTKLEPLFPGYLFTRFRMDPSTWHAIHWTPGARQILTSGERPMPVADEIIETIWARIAPLGFLRVGIGLNQGDRVRVKVGPFAGLEGIFERPTTRQDRVRVLLDLLGSSTPLELDVFDLERI